MFKVLPHYSNYYFLTVGNIDKFKILLLFGLYIDLYY